MTNRIQLEPEAQAFAEAAAKLTLAVHSWSRKGTGRPRGGASGSGEQAAGRHRGSHD